LKANPNLHAVKYHQSKFKNLLKRKRFFWETARIQHVCACQGGSAFVLEKVPAKGTRHGQDHWSYASRRLS
jgi:hypothetical protein